MRYNRVKTFAQRMPLFRGLLLLLNYTGVLRLVTRLLLDRRVPVRLKMLFPAAVAYVISPVDLVHDFIPWIGRVDDLLALLLALVLFLGLAPKDLVLEHLGKAPANSSGGPPDGSTVIEGKYRVLDDEN